MQTIEIVFKNTICMKALYDIKNKKIYHKTQVLNYVEINVLTPFGCLYKKGVFSNIVGSA